MHHHKFEQLFSHARISRYMVAASGNAAKSQQLYSANLTVAQAFYPLLSLLEVILRNKINALLAIYFADDNWISTQTTGFMADHSLHRLNRFTGKMEPDYYLKNEVTKAISHLRRSNATITPGKIVAEQTFGFWTELFEKKYYRLIEGKPIQIFTALPSGYNRAKILDELTMVRKFRNRIYHNEPICFNANNQFDFSNAMLVHQSIKGLLNFIDIDLLAMLTEIDSVSKYITMAQNIL